jgi:hypothetical protein
MLKRDAEPVRASLVEMEWRIISDRGAEVAATN